MAAILKVGCQNIENPTPSIDAYLLEQSSQISSRISPRSD